MTYPTDKTIGQLDLAQDITDADRLALFQGTVTNRLTIQQLKAVIAAGVPNPPALPALCTVTRTTNLTWGGGAIYLPWETSTGSLASAWTIGDPTHITIPPGYSYARFSANHRFYNSNSQGVFAIWLEPTISPPVGVGRNWVVLGNQLNQPTFLCAQTAIVPVTPGDKWRCRLDATPAGAAGTIASVETWMQAEFFN